MKIALITANIGGIDNKIIKPVKQTVEYDYYEYTDELLPYPLPNLNNRLKGKYLKTLTHRFLPDYDIYIWIDGNVQVTSPKFVEMFAKTAELHDIVIAKHPNRNNVFDEIDFILKAIKDKVPYLTQRYKNEPFMEERNFLTLQDFPKDYPLFACRVFARKNNDKLNKAFNDWWIKCLEFTNFDQTMFSFIAHENELKIVPMEYSVLEKYIIKNKHSKII